MGKWCAFLCGCVVSCVSAVVLAAESPADTPYEVGVGQVDVTPTYPIRLNGFGFRREESEGITQQIWAKALAIRQRGSAPVVLITVDSLGLRWEQVDEVAARLMAKHGLSRERIAVTYTHSHTTPKVNGAADNIFSQPIPAAHQAHIDQYTRELVDGLERAAELALGDLQPASLAWGLGRVGFALNRRTAGGPVDHDLPVLAVYDAAGQLRAVYVSYACHCVTLSYNRISGDWAGFAQAKLQADYPGCVALVSIGAGSDSNPSSGVTGDKVDVAAAQGEEIARETARVLAGPLRPITGPIAAELQTISLPLNPPPTRAAWEAMAAAGGPEGYNAQTQLARLDRSEPLLTAIAYPIQSFVFGDSLHMLFLADEVCVDYALRLKRELDAQRLWVNAYSNDFACYIPSERLAREGGYGGGAEIPYFALPSTLAASLEQQIVDEVHRQARAIER